MRLPEWNDLSNDQRDAIVAVVDYNVGGTDAEHYSGQIALEVYLKVREIVSLDMPPLIAPLHAEDEGRHLTSSRRPGYRQVARKTKIPTSGNNRPLHDILITISCTAGVAFDTGVITLPPPEP